MKTSAFALLAAATTTPLVLAQDASSISQVTTPGGVNHSTQPAVPLPDTSTTDLSGSAYFSNTFSSSFHVTSTANYSTSLTVPTTTTTTTTATAISTTDVDTTSSTPSSSSLLTVAAITTTSVVVVTPVGGGDIQTSTRVVVFTPTLQVPAATTAPGQLANSAEKLQNDVQIAALAGLVAVCGIMGML